MTDNLDNLTVVEQDAGIEVSLAEASKKDEPGKETKIQTPAEGIDELKAALDKSRREAAERLAAKDREIQQAFERANTAEKAAGDAKKDAVSTALDLLTREKDAAKRDLREALKSGDHDAAAEAQERISLVAARIVEAEKGKLALEEEIKQPTPQPRQAQNGDPVDALVSRLSPRSADWVRAHPEYVRTPQLNDAMVEAHNYALRQGHVVDSDSYFQAINQRLGLDDAAPQPDRGRQARQERETTQSPISAPVTRSAPSTSKANPSVVRLTAEEVATAEALGMKPEVYAKHLVALAKEGKINRAF